MIETIAADTILSVFSGIYYHILCVEHGRQGKKLAACVLSLIVLNMILDLVLYGQDVFSALTSFVLTVLFVLCWIPWLYNVPRGRVLLYAMIQYGLVVLILLPLSMVFPCLFLSDLILPGYLVKGVIYVIACPICLRFVKRRRESGIFRDLPSAGAPAAEQCGVIDCFCLSGKDRGAVVYAVLADLFRGGGIQWVCAVSFWREDAARAWRRVAENACR